MKLPETQVAVLEAASADDPRTVESIAEETGEPEASVAGAAFALEEEGLLDVEEATETELELTEEGETYEYEALPEHALWVGALSLGADEDPVEIGQAIGTSNLDEDRVEVALANFARKGMGSIDEGEVVVDPDFVPDNDPEKSALSTIAQGAVSPEGYADDVVDQLRRRGLVTERERTVRRVTLTEAGVTALMEGVEVAETVGQVTSELITSGEWAEVEFADYNVEADAETTYGGKHHPLRQLVDRVSEVLVGMGFQEMQGPHVDADFFIHDCLFMPQDHPA
ncbi:MAG: phenylalanine--tRNA ligase subunit alpha, partial [Haloarculaceae archaeon]